MNLSDKICRYSYPINGKLLKTEGLESVLYSKKFSLPKCVLIDKFIGKNEINNLKVFIKYIFNYLHEEYAGFRELFNDETQENSKNNAHHELYFYLGSA
jgi:hypothetical protein